MNNEISITNLSKYYNTKSNKKYALKNININIKKNKIVGLLGPNGAGKTTLLNLITNKITKNSGEICINNMPLKSPTNQNIVCMMNNNELSFKQFSIEKLFKISKSYYKFYDSTYETKLTNLFHIDKSKKYSALSKGQKGIVNSVIALSSKAPITILDETFVSLDPLTRNLLFKEIIIEYSNFPRTFIISTHYIDEISSLLEDVIILYNGNIIINSTKDSIDSMALTISGDYNLGISLLKNTKILNSSKFGQIGTFLIYDTLSNESLQKLKSNNFEINHTSLNNFFINIIKENLI